MQFKTEKIMNPKNPELVNGNCWQTLNSNNHAIGHHKNNKANFNEDLKVDEAFIFGNYGASEGPISKWNLNHLNDPREGTIVEIISAQCDFIWIQEHGMIFITIWETHAFQVQACRSFIILSSTLVESFIDNNAWIWFYCYNKIPMTVRSLYLKVPEIEKPGTNNCSALASRKLVSNSRDTQENRLIDSMLKN